MYPKVSIIILNWNGWKDSIECLESLYQINYPNYNAILVDNGSNNDSLKKIKDYCNGKIKVESQFYEYDPNNKPIKIAEYEEENVFIVDEKEKKFADLHSSEKLIIIKNNINYGFTKGNNIAIKYAMQFLDPNYILLLNNDTVVEKDFLNELIKVGEKNKKVGFLGPKIYFYDFKGKKEVIQYAGSKQNLWFFNPENKGIFEIDHGQYDKLELVEYVHGACLLAKVEMIKEIGVLDEEFFSYREENDWGIRGYKKGWDSLYVPNSKIWHKGGKSTGGNFSPLAVFYRTRNDFIFMKKHGSVLQNISFLIYFLIFRLLVFCGTYIFYHRNFKVIFPFLNGFKEGILWRRKN
ncbi:MAG: glycosyltransferase family 2 protein [Methanobacterium sp.]|jgi:GT2 family glycosyltransferase